MITAFLDFLMPRKCVVCGRNLALREQYICIFCLAGLPGTHFSLMSRNQMADRLNDMLNRDSAEEIYEGGYSYACALFFYNAHTRYKYITRGLKYQAEIGMGKYFSRMLGEKLAASPFFADVDAVVPVPLHWRRRLQRGYNQAEVIASEIGRALGAEVFVKMLYRHSRTKSQAHLKLSERADNVASAFKVSKRYAETISSGKMNMPHHILIVDDVFTTGATVHACFLALRVVVPPSVRISVATLAVVGA